jgi:DNA-directed RNA polymerase subunit L
MKVSNKVENTDQLSFVLSGVDTSIANGIRRVILSDIPTVGIVTTPLSENTVNITYNSTRFNNEVIKQRLSCLPIHITDLSMPLEQLEIELDVENETNDYMYVTTEDIKIKNKDTGSYLSKDDTRSIFPSNPQTGYYIDIVRLRPRLSPETPGERLAFTANMTIVTASVNSMFNVVSTCSYGNTIHVDEMQEKMKLKEQELRDSGAKMDDIMFKLNDWKLLDAQRIYLPDSFDFTIKTVGVFTCDEIMKIACDVMTNRFQKLTAILTSDKKNEAISIVDTDSTLSNGFDIKLEEEDHTIGMVLRYLLYSTYQEGVGSMNYCGCRKLHPHDSYIMLRLGYKDETDKSDVIDNMVDACNKAVAIFQDIKNMF